MAVPWPSRTHIRSAAGGALAALVLLSAGCTTGAAQPAHPSRPAPTPRTATAPLSSPATDGPSAPVRPSGRFTISFAGDVNFAERTAALLDHPATAFGPAAAVLRRADLTMVNLETAITAGGDRQAKEFTFRAPPTALTALRDAGIDVATMANNHGADYGAAGLRDSLRASRESGFPVIGIGADARQAFAPYRTTLAGVKVAIFAADQVRDETTLRLFSAGPATIGVADAYSPRLVRAVRAAARAGRVVIVYLHWGIEFHTCPSSDQATLAGRLAAAGASAVVGTHAHVLQGAGWRRDGTYVAYGLGNYLWWRSIGNDQDDNGVLTLTFDRSRVVAAHFAPSHLNSRGIPVPATGSEKRRIDAEWADNRGCTDLSARPPR